MSNYVQITDFSAKDALPTGDPGKLILGSDVDAELAAIVTAITSKFDAASVASDAQAAAFTSDSTVISPLRLKYALENGTYDLADGVTKGGNGIVLDTRTITPGTGLSGGGDLSANRSLALSHLGLESLVDPNADRIAFWDDSAGAFAWLTPSTGLSLSGTNLTTNDSQIDHDSLSGFVSNKHVDHSLVSITAGDGLTGGGTIATSRSISVNSSVVRTSGTQTIGGAKTFSSDVVFSAAAQIGNDFVTSGLITNSSGGTLSDVSTTNAAIIRFTNIGSVTLTGLAGGITGRRIVIINLTGGAMAISEENVGSAPANRFRNGLGGTQNIAQDGALEFIYDSTSARWQRIDRLTV